MCRRCGQRDETTAHVLSSCSTMFPEYTKRHDSIEAILISTPQSRKLISPTIHTYPLPGYCCRQSTRDNRCHVPSGQYRHLIRGLSYDNKVAKYSSLGHVLPLVVRNLGSWLPTNDHIRGKLGIPTFEQRSCGFARSRPNICQGTMMSEVVETFIVVAGQEFELGDLSSSQSLGNSSTELYVC